MFEQQKQRGTIQHCRTMSHVSEQKPEDLDSAFHIHLDLGLCREECVGELLSLPFILVN